MRTTTTTIEPARRAPAPSRGSWAGAGGLAFVGIVMLQNAVRAGAPAPDAKTAELVRYFHDHRPTEWVLAATFTVSGVALARYAGGLWKVVTERAPEARDWLLTGLLGVTGIFAIFTTMVACEMGLGVAARRASTAGAVVPALWTLHNALFALLNLMIGIALLGLSRAAVRAGVAPTAFLALGSIGAGLLALGAAFAPSITESMSATALPSLLGFLVWLAFVAVSGWCVLRLDRAPTAGGAS